MPDIRYPGPVQEFPEEVRGMGVGVARRAG